jgi:hypothetical protein
VAYGEDQCAVDKSSLLFSSKFFTTATSAAAFQFALLVIVVATQLFTIPKIAY